MKIFFLIIALFLFLKISSQTNTWDGSTDTDWHKTCNWSLDLIPTCSHDVVIPTVTNYPIITGTAHSKSVSITSAAANALTLNSSGGGLLYVGSSGGSCLGTATDNGGCAPACAAWTKAAGESFAVAGDANGIYLGGTLLWGFSFTDYDWHLEKRDVGTGVLVGAFGTAGVINSGYYNYNIVYGLAVDASSLYAVGTDQGFERFRVEKRNRTTGALNWAQTYNNNTGVGGGDIALAVAVDAGGVYSVGYINGIGFTNEVYMEKRDISTGALIWSQTPGNFGIASAVAVDASGVYVLGANTIEKRSLTTGALIGSFGTGGVVILSHTISRLVINGSAIYAAGYDFIPGDSEWRIEKYDLATGALVAGFGTGGAITSNPTVGTDQANDLAIDNTGIYVLGDDGNGASRLEKRDLTTGASLCTKTLAAGENYRILVTPSGIYLVGRYVTDNLCTCP